MSMLSFRKQAAEEQTAAKKKRKAKDQVPKAPEPAASTEVPTEAPTDAPVVQ